MNILDYLETGEPPEPESGDMLQEIFAQQALLEAKYDLIEAERGMTLSPDRPLDLDSRLGQAQFKDGVFRIVEEICEATLTFSETREQVDRDHFYEELADALHFFIRCFLLAGWNFRRVQESLGGTSEGDALVACMEPVSPEFLLPDLDTSFAQQDLFRAQMYWVVEGLFEATGTLKNRPWKQTEMPTDLFRFGEALKQAFEEFLRGLSMLGLTAEAVYRLYWAKNQVNQFRQRTNY